MNVILAETAGFCFGVERAINLVHEQIDKADGKEKYLLTDRSFIMRKS